MELVASKASCQPCCRSPPGCSIAGLPFPFYVSDVLDEFTVADRDRGLFSNAEAVSSCSCSNRSSRSKSLHKTLHLPNSCARSDLLAARPFRSKSRCVISTSAVLRRWPLARCGVPFLLVPRLRCLVLQDMFPLMPCLRCLVLRRASRC